MSRNLVFGRDLRASSLGMGANRCLLRSVKSRVNMNSIGCDPVGRFANVREPAPSGTDSFA
jgi:hypothetical protein